MNNLYHYCSTETFSSIINGKSIWLSSLALSNDSQEGKVIRDIIQYLVVKNDLSAQHAEVIYRFFDPIYDLMDGLAFCLSEQGDLLSQWRGYADDGRGLSIGFSKDYLLGISKHGLEGKKHVRLKKVIYDESEQVDLVSSIFGGLLEDVKQGAIDIPKPNLLVEQQKIQLDQHSKAMRSVSMAVLESYAHIYTLKNPAFREEQEWRLLMHTSLSGSKEECCFRAASNRLIPYCDISLVDTDISPINEVILGPRNTTPISFLKSFLEAQGFTDVSIRKSSATYR